MSSPLAAYVLLFLAVGAAFVLVNLLVGKLIRPHKPDAEKGTVYECGEPTIGSAWVQFDLRYYVIALLFVIFDVEVAFFFPWAEVFGKANAIREVGSPVEPKGADATNKTAEMARDADTFHRLADRALPLTSVPPDRFPTDPEKAQHSRVAAVRTWAQLRLLTDEKLNRYNALLKQAQRTPAETQELEELLPSVKAAKWVYDEANELRWLAFVEIVIFFGVLLVGFAYLWRRGDLAWVRSLPERQALAREAPPLAATPARPAPTPAETVAS
jgi:NADH-quinone oxidoreductase subunit A